MTFLAENGRGIFPATPKNSGLSFKLKDSVMDDYGRRIVIDLGFEAVLGEASRAIREEGLQMIARIDVRDHLWRNLGHDFRRYFLLEAWSPELALEALRYNLEAGTILPMTLAIYELAMSTLAVFLWALAYAPAQAVTMSFMTLALAQIFHLGNARSHQPVLDPAHAFANRYAVGAVVISVMLQIASAQFAPLGMLLRVVSLGFREWWVVFLFSSVTALVGQVIRLVAR